MIVRICDDDDVKDSDDVVKMGSEYRIGNENVQQHKRDSQYKYLDG